MTQTAPPPPGPAPAVRPATVTAAVALQLALAGTLLLIIGLTIADAVHYDTLIDRAAATTRAARDDVSGERAANLFGTLAVALPALLLAGWFAVAARWVRRGSNVARILTLAGLGTPLLLGLLACLVGGLGGLLLTGLLLIPADGTFPDEAEVDFSASDGFYDTLWQLDSDGWSAASDALGLTATVLALILAVSVAVLLLIDPSSRYFRPARVRPVYQPYAVWPPSPSYPSYGPPPYGSVPGPPPPPPAAESEAV